MVAVASVMYGKVPSLSWISFLTVSFIAPNTLPDS